MSEIQSCPACESPLVDSELERAFDGSPFKRCSNRDCYGLSSGTARALVEARTEIERLKADVIRERAMTDAMAEKFHSDETAIKLAAYETQISSLQVDRTEAKVMIRELMRREEALIAKAEETNAALVAMTAERDENEGVFKVWRRRCEEAESQIDALKVELAAMTKERDAMKAWGEDQHNALGIVQMQRDHAEKARDAALSEIERMRGEDYHRVRDALIETLRKERDEARKQQQYAWERHAEKDRAYGKMIAERDAAVERAEAAEAQLAKVRRDLDTMISVHDEVEADRDQLREENARLKSSYDYNTALQAERVKLEALLGRAVAAAQPFVDYYNKLAKWGGGCALPPEPTQGQRIDFVNVFTDATATQAADAWRAQQEEREAADAIRDYIKATSGGYINPHAGIGPILQRLCDAVDARRGQGGRQ